MTYASTVLADSPLLYWKLDDAALSATAADASGNGRTGTVTAWNFQQASQFPGSSMGSTAGTNGKIVSPSIAFGSTQVTVEAWVNFYGANGATADAMLFSFGTNYLDVMLEAGRLGFNTGAGDRYGCAIPPPGLHHIVVVFPNAQATTNGKIYIDGVLQTLSGVSGTAPTLGTTTVQVSSWPPSSQPLPAGVYVDDVSVYSGPLSAARVLAHYSAGIANDPFASAWTVQPSSSVAISTAGYSTEASESLVCPSAATAWFTVTPPYSAVWQIDTIGSSFDTGLSVYTGTALNNLVRVAYDDNSGGSSTSRLALELIGGTQYYIQAGSGPNSAGATGTLQLNIAPQSRYNGFGTATPSASAQGGNQINAGTGFTTSRLGQSAVGARVFIQSGASGDLTGAIAYLYALGGGGYPVGPALATANFPTLIKGAWNEVLFTTAYPLTPGTVYYVVVYLKANLYFTLTNEFTSAVPAPSGAAGLTFVADTAAHHNGVFADGAAAGTVPNSTFSSEWLGVDVILDTGTVSMGWGPSL